MTTVKCPEMLRLGVKTNGAKAQTIVEFSLICLPFFALLFALIDYAQIYFYDNSLQNGLRECARFTTAGSIIQATDGNGSPLYETNVGGVVVPKAISDSEGREASRNECSRYWFLSNCVVALPLSNIIITSTSVPSGSQPPVATNANGRLYLIPGSESITNADGSVTPSMVFGPGAANNYIEVSAHYTISTITPLFSYLGGYSHSGWNSYPLYLSAIVKNEPALLNFEHTNAYTDEPGYSSDTSQLEAEEQGSSSTGG